ncbi:MAG: GYD domain-containing protein [Candidatus Bathyarchaeia archaeon]
MSRHRPRRSEQYDFVNIVEAPDNETISQISVELGSRGTIQMMSMPAIAVDQFITRVKKK